MDEEKKPRMIPSAALRQLLQNFMTQSGEITVPIDDTSGEFAVDPLDVLDAFDSVKYKPPNYDQWRKRFPCDKRREREGDWVGLNQDGGNQR